MVTFTDENCALRHKTAPSAPTSRLAGVPQRLREQDQRRARPRTCRGSNRADGLIKHLVHEKLNTREMCVEAYMQFLKPGEKSGKHRHMWEEMIFVVEGSGYDLHWT